MLKKRTFIPICEQCHRNRIILKFHFNFSHFNNLALNYRLKKIAMMINITYKENLKGYTKKY